MFRKVTFKTFEDGHVGYNYCRGCLKKKTRKKWGYSFCSRGCLVDWIDKNRLIFCMLGDYKDIIFDKNFNVSKLFSFDHATKILTPVIFNEVTKNIKGRVNDIITEYLRSDSVEMLLNAETQKEMFDKMVVSK